MNAALPLAPQGKGWICERDPRLRILLALAFALVTVSLSHPSALLAALLLALALALVSGIPTRLLTRRLLALEGFMAILLISLPFTVPGPALLDLGPLHPSGAGTLLALGILLKANGVVIALMALVGTLEPVVFGHALARLGVPEKLAHLLLMTVQQIHRLHEEFLRLRQAMRARAFVPRSDRHTWKSYAWLTGMLLVRSMERSRRILAAMRCRCFQGRLYLLDSTRWRTADTLLAIGFTLLLAGLPMLDHWR